jgi:hypothetical protein
MSIFSDIEDINFSWQYCNVGRSIQTLAICSTLILGILWWKYVSMQQSMEIFASIHSQKFLSEVMTFM